MDVLRHAGRARALGFAGGSNAGDGRGAVGGRAVHRGRPPEAGRRPARSTSARRAADRHRRRQLPRGRQPVHRRGEARPDQAAGRVRGDRQGRRSRSCRPTSSPRPRWSAGSSARAAARSSQFSAARGRARGALRRSKGGDAAFADFRAAEDPEAPTTVLSSKRFPYQAPPKQVAAGSVARPDPGTLKLEPPARPAARSSPASRRAPPTRCSSPARTRRAGTR